MGKPVASRVQQMIEVVRQSPDHMHESKVGKICSKREPAHTRLRWCWAIFFPPLETEILKNEGDGERLASPLAEASWGSSAMTTRPDLSADRRIEGGGYTVRRPRRGPSDAEVRMLINMQQEGEIAFQLHSLAQLQFIGGSALLASLLTTAPRASISATSTSKARPPSLTGRPSASTSRRLGNTWKRPNATLADGLELGRAESGHQHRRSTRGLDGVFENPSLAASRTSDRPRAALSRAVCCESKNA